MAQPEEEAQRTRITVLISGSGTNLQALIDACASNTLPSASIVRVISNRKSAYGLVRATNAGIPTAYHNLLEYKRRYPNEPKDGAFSEAREEYDKDLAEIVLKDKPDLVVCAGWMHILAPTFLDPLVRVKIPVINLHPALPGAFNGANAIQRAYTAFQEGKIQETGVMVHYVISEVDMGTPILVRKIPFKEGESLEALEERIHQNEWEVILQGTAMALVALRDARNQ